MVQLRIEDKKLEKAAYVLKAVAHPVRIKIIDLLEQSKAMTVTEIQEELGLEQSLVSHHLKQLKDKGILETRKDGRFIYYELGDPTISNIIGCINGCKIF